MESGAQFVMILGMTLMLVWSALKWDTPDEVCTVYEKFSREWCILSQKSGLL